MDEAEVSYDVPDDKAFVDEVVNSPRPVPIVQADDEHNFQLDEKSLSDILLRNDVAELPVVVISVAGAFRKGKSFLLNFFIRYLSKNCPENESDWLGDFDEPLVGFSWRGGSERDTTGILMWSEVFKVTIPQTDKTVAVLLMDTQGAFDSSSTVKDCATIFALSTMTSSVQVYNLSQNIQEDDLQHLELFTEYGRLAIEESNCKPFQCLQFLVRDWSYPYEREWGEKGGNELLERRLELSKSQHSELQRVRSHIRACFNELGCYLLPHPGLTVATSPYFKGCVKDLQPEFKEHIIKLVPLIASPASLQVKQINGSEINCRELLEYFRSYIKIYHGEELPEPKTMLQATAEANNLAAVSKCRDIYTSSMDERCGCDCGFVSPPVLEDHHHRIMEQAMEKFDQIRKMGGTDFSASYRAKLENSIKDLYESYSANNEAKNVLTYTRTPLIYLIVCICTYVLSGLLYFLYLAPLANLAHLLSAGCIIAIALWVYVRWLGDNPQLSRMLDLVADGIWEHVRSWVTTAVVQNASYVSEMRLGEVDSKLKSS